MGVEGDLKSPTRFLLERLVSHNHSSDKNLQEDVDAPKLESPFSFASTNLQLCFSAATTSRRRRAASPPSFFTPSTSDRPKLLLLLFEHSFS